MGSKDATRVRITTETARLRSGDDGFWVGLRRLLRGRDIDISATVVAEMSSAGEGTHAVVIVTPPHRVLRFAYQCPPLRPIGEGSAVA